MKIRRLEATDDRSAFASGNEDLDVHFRLYALQNQQRHRISATYVAEVDGVVAGFVTITGGTLDPGVLRTFSVGNSCYECPVLRLARLATDVRFRGRGVGTALLRHGMLLAIGQRDTVGCTGIVVDAKPDAVRFYENLGFKEIGCIDEPGPTRLMFLTIKQIAAAMAATAEPAPRGK